jgi:hypothetical protein
VRNCSLLDDSLIKEEIIVIKTLVDYGKPMRLQAFLFLQTALDEPTNQAFDMLGLYPQILQAAMQRICNVLSLIQRIKKKFRCFLPGSH